MSIQRRAFVTALALTLSALSSTAVHAASVSGEPLKV